MMVVFAKKEGTVIWSDNNSTHKAGRVPLHEPLNVTSENNESWYGLSRPENLTLPAQSGYPDYWVKRSDTIDVLPVEEPIDPSEPTEPTGLVSETDAALAILTLIRWLKQ